MTDIIKKNFNIVKAISAFDEKHPYLLSFIVSAGLMGFILFKSGGTVVFRDEVVPAEKLTFVDIEEITPPQRQAKQEISDDGEVKAESKKVKRATGSSDSKVVDLAFAHPNVVHPKIVGRLPKLHPKIAKEENVEATVFTEIIISSEGKVRSVTVLHVKLSKKLPEELSAAIKKEFIKSTKKTFYAAKFTPPIVDGKKVTVKMEMPIRFKLN